MDLIRRSWCRKECILSGYAGDFCAVGGMSSSLNILFNIVELNIQQINVPVFGMDAYHFQNAHLGTIV